MSHIFTRPFHEALGTFQENSGGGRRRRRFHSEGGGPRILCNLFHPDTKRYLMITVLKVTTNVAIEGLSHPRPSYYAPKHADFDRLTYC